MKPTVLSTGALALLAAAAALAAEPVSPAQVSQQIQGKAAPFVLDVRTPGEYGAGHVPGATNIPVQMLDQRLSEVPKDREVVVYCESGGRAAKAATLLGDHGYTRVHEMTGSMAAWRNAKLPVEK